MSFKNYLHFKKEVLYYRKFERYRIRKSNVSNDRCLRNLCFPVGCICLGMVGDR